MSIVVQEANLVLTLDTMMATQFEGFLPKEWDAKVGRSRSHSFEL